MNVKRLKAALLNDKKLRQDPPGSAQKKKIPANKQLLKILTL